MKVACKNKVQINNCADVRIASGIYGMFIEHLGRCIYDGLYVGEDSLIPNIRGIRADVVAALREIKMPVVRWPGGCFASIYHWKDGIGPKEQRPVYTNNNMYHTVEDNQFGTHEFLDFCELIDAEPYICVNIESGTVREMVEWIEYITHPYDTPMSRLRRSNGRLAPWRLKYVGLGNENWGGGGNMRPEYYADVARQYSTFAINYSGRDDLFKIFAGPHKHDYAWTDYMMNKSLPYQPDDHWGKNLMHGLSLHCYIYGGDYYRSSPDVAFSEEEYAHVLAGAFNYETLLQKHSEIMDENDPGKEIKIVFDEWGAWYAPAYDKKWTGTPFWNTWYLNQQATQRDAVLAAVAFDGFNKHADRLQIATLSQSINSIHPMILTEPNSPRMVCTPTYQVFKMYMPHRGARLMDVEISAETYTCGETNIPAISASASQKDGQIFVTLTNTHFSQEEYVQILLPVDAQDVLRAEILESSGVDACNTFDQPDLVSPHEFTAFQRSENRIEVKMPPHSIAAFSIRL